MKPADAALFLCTALHLGALMAWFGALALRRLLGAGQGGGELRYLRIFGALALASAALWPCVQAAVLREQAAAAWDPASIALVLTETSFGRIWLVRAAIIALALLASGWPMLAIGRGVLLLVAVALGSMALLGHSGSAGPLAQGVQALHLLAAGAWLGALPVLVVLAGRLAGRDLARVLQWFSRYGLAIVTVVLGTGVLTAAWRLGGWGALATGDYRRLLLGKIALVAAMGALALRNRNQLTPRLLAPQADAIGDTQRALRRTIASEAALGVAVVLVAVLLAAAEPPQ